MRIGIDCTALVRDWAGMRNYTSGLVSSLLSAGSSHDWILLGNMDGLAIPRGTRVRGVPSPGILNRTMLAMGGLTLEHLLGPLDVFHTHSVTPFALRRGRKLVTVPDLTPIIGASWHAPRKVMVYRWVLPRTLGDSDRIIALSHSTKRDLVRYFGTDPGMIDVIHLAHSPSFHPMTGQEAAPVLRRHGLSYQGYILFMGTIEPRKNIPRLIEACKRISILPLVIVGKTGWKYEAILRHIESSGGAARWIGYVPAADLPALVASARVLAYPSLYEGFGLPPLEAMASGVPVVTSNRSSMPEVVGEAGLLVSPESTDEIAESVLRLVSDGDLRARLVEAGLKRAANFNWEKTARAVLETYLRATR